MFSGNVGQDLWCYMAALGHNKLTHWPLRDVAAILKLKFSNSLYESISWVLPAKLLGMHQTPINGKSRLWLGAIRQQAVTWVNIDQDLYHHMLSLSHNELTHYGLRASKAYMYQVAGLSWAQVMAWHLFSTKPSGSRVIMSSGNGLTPV